MVRSVAITLAVLFDLGFVETVNLNRNSTVSVSNITLDVEMVGSWMKSFAVTICDGKCVAFRFEHNICS